MPVGHLCCICLAYKVLCERSFVVPGTVYKVPCERTFVVPGMVYKVPCERTFVVPETVHKVLCERSFFPCCQSERRCGGQSISSLIQSLSEEVNMEVKKPTGGAPRGSLLASLITFLRTSNQSSWYAMKS